MPLIMTRPTLIGWSGALFGCFLLPTGSPSTFPDTLPGAHSRSEQREPAGSTVHHRIRLASLPRAAPAQQARILGAINTYLAPTSLPELLNANSLQRGHVTSTQDYFLYNKRGAGERHCSCSPSTPIALSGHSDLQQSHHSMFLGTSSEPILAPKGANRISKAIL